MIARFINRLTSTPWHIGPSAGRTIISHMILSLLKNERPAQDMFGDPLPQMSIQGNAGVIPIGGILMLNCPDWIKQYGFNVTDPNDIEDEIQLGLDNPRVDYLLLDTDSPGGESIAGEKLYDLVEAAGKVKPVFSWTADGAQCCSAAYQGGAPSMAMLSGKFAEMGCIGTYMAYLDDSGYWEQFGLKWETFRSGSLKGIDGALTPEQRAYFENMTADYGARFRSGVLKYRTGIDPANMEGQTFRGVEAAQLGFTAGTAADIDEAMQKFSRMAQ